MFKSKHGPFFAFESFTIFIAVFRLQLMLSEACDTAYLAAFAIKNS